MISGIILAAGSSTRMGKQKLLLDIEGLKIIEKVTKEVVESSYFDEIIFVYYEDEVKKAVEDYNVMFIKNPNPQRGLSSSINIGISKTSESTDKYMFFMGDQPFINKELIIKLIDEYNNSLKSIIVPIYNGNKGMPTIFSSKWKNNFFEIKGDVGGRIIIQNNPKQVAFVQVEDYISSIDVDTKEAYCKAIEVAKSRV